MFYFEVTFQMKMFALMTQKRLGLTEGKVIALLDVENKCQYVVQNNESTGGL